FEYREGKPFLKVLDTRLRKVNEAGYSPIKFSTQAPVQSQEGGKPWALVLNLQEKQFPFFKLDVVEGEFMQGKKPNHVELIDVTKKWQQSGLNEHEKECLQWIRKLQVSEINKHVSKHSAFGDLWENLSGGKDLPDVETRQLIYTYLHPKLLTLFNRLSPEQGIYILPPGKPYRSASLVAVEYRHHNVYPRVEVSKKGQKYQLKSELLVDDVPYALQQPNNSNGLLFWHGEHLYLCNKPADASDIDFLREHDHVTSSEWNTVLQQHLIPMSKRLEIDFQDGLIQKLQAGEPGKAVILKEQGTYFIIQPAFDYEGELIPWNDEKLFTRFNDGRMLVMERNTLSEKVFVDFIESLHPGLRKPEYEFQFALPGKQALSQNWFFRFYEQLREQNVKIYGYENLKQFRINEARPNTRVVVSSGQDWFDTKVEIDFGGQTVPLELIRKLITKKDNLVPLGDGTLGMLPDEWLEQFSLLFKMATPAGDTLRVSKYNFTVIDELHDLIDDEVVLQELAEKKKNLLETEITHFNQTAIPDNVQATLRPYQEAGFRWLAYLDHIGWGGLLADDMGLGKTLQTLTFLQHVKNKQGALFAVVVCPTTLIYNWEKEIGKFTPNLTYVLHHGNQRSMDIHTLMAYNIIITTYGTMRSDAPRWVDMPFDYVVLDESQTIKNPLSKTAKAVHVLQCKNRIALSGTPMQNNTFDLYSQMHFLNPGMLGTKEFFKEQFAKPVDKFQDEDTKRQLRRLVFPFLLRRTKEQVASDLPEKTEMTLYCEMGKEQRAVYEMHRDRYRSMIMGNIEQQGIQKSQFAILQGLMKLRQICDSPAILNEGVPYENHSVKLTELVRELTENMGNHKALVFSQFLGMLALVRKELEHHGIQYQYFDGSYSAQERETAIRQFQENEKCSVFLISLKAGGMGLNLTAADYVYIVDPWWNPAVEQQAIDRTHRIGQTKNIFAYRMICKDTVEEKIMQLKDKKNALVKDIISDDQQVVKSLTREDVEFLFS
ncbi:MAG: DEAD/DEAH box helicase, partial [Chitinophagaceae bacterium]